MKNLLLAFLLLISAHSFAQKNQPSISIGPSFGDPMNTGGTEYFKKGIGAALKGYYPVSKNGSLMANFNFISYKAKEKYTIDYSLTSFKFGYKTFIGNSNFFAYADAGLVLLHAKDVITASQSNTVTYGFGAGIGYSFPVTKNSFIDFTPNINFNNAMFGRKLSPEVNLSYRINLGKK